MICHVTTDFMRGLFTNLMFSENGSTERVKEEGVYMMFLDYLDNCEFAIWPFFT